MKEQISLEYSILRRKHPLVFIILTPVEFAITSKLYEAKNDIVATEELYPCLDRVRKHTCHNNISAHVKEIRAKFKKHNIPLEIVTYRMKGFLLK